jgi:hypothetical protein
VLAVTAPSTHAWDQIPDHPQAKATIFKNNIDTAPFSVVRNLNARMLQAKATIFLKTILKRLFFKDRFI